MSSLSSKTQFLSTHPTKKDQNICSCQKRSRGQDQGQNTPAIGVNATAIRKNKDKDKDKKDLANIKCYNYKQQGHYANKCLEKEPKN